MAAKTKEFVKIGRAAQEIGMTRRTLERWIEKGKFKGYKLGKFMMVEREYLEDWKKKNIIEVAA